MKAKRIQLIHLFSNGDCLYATTIAKQIKIDFPGSHLTWVVSSKCSSIVNNHPDVDAIAEIVMEPNADPVAVYENLIENARQLKANGEIDEYFATQILGDKFAYYDGCVRTSIYRTYPNPITVDMTPVLKLTFEEDKKVADFAALNKLRTYKNIILFECAPLSGQIKITDEMISKIVSGTSNATETCFILSSAKKIHIPFENVIDGSKLSIRETAGLANFCTLLLGCSSGITWATTSTAGKLLPMVQILDKEAYIYNPPSIAMKVSNRADLKLIELFDFTTDDLIKCLNTIFNENFDTAKKLYNQQAKKQFKIFRGITSMFIRQGKFKLLFHFIRMNIGYHGFNIKMISMFIKGMFLFPFSKAKNK